MCLGCTSSCKLLALPLLLLSELFGPNFIQDMSIRIEGLVACRGEVHEFLSEHLALFTERWVSKLSCSPLGLQSSNQALQCLFAHIKVHSIHSLGLSDNFSFSSSSNLSNRVLSMQLSKLIHHLLVLHSLLLDCELVFRNRWLHRLQIFLNKAPTLGEIA